MQKSDKIQLAIGSIAVPLAIAGVAMLESKPIITYILFGIAAIAMVWGVWSYIFKRRRKQSKSIKPIRQNPLPKIAYDKIQNVTPEDKKVINSMMARMFSVHGHLDGDGLMSDRGSGIALNDLMEKPCSKCGVPRNRRGKRG